MTRRRVCSCLLPHPPRRRFLARRGVNPWASDIKLHRAADGGEPGIVEHASFRADGRGSCLMAPTQAASAVPYRLPNLRPLRIRPYSDDRARLSIVFGGHRDRRLSSELRINGGNGYCNRNPLSRFNPVSRFKISNLQAILVIGLSAALQMEWPESHTRMSGLRASRFLGWNSRTSARLPWEEHIDSRTAVRLLRNRIQNFIADFLGPVNIFDRVPRRFAGCGDRQIAQPHHALHQRLGDMHIAQFS